MTQRIGVLGAGQMGRGIAQVAAQAGYEVVLADATAEMEERARGMIAGQLGKLVEKGKLGASDRDAVVARIVPGVGPDSLTGVDFAIEAVTEDETVKLEIF